MLIKTLLISLVALTVAWKTATAQITTTLADSSAMIVGKWVGTYDGTASGDFELMIDQDASRKLTGRIAVMDSNGGRQSANLKTVSWQKGQLAFTYTDPGSGDEVIVNGNYESSALKGTWDAGGGQATGKWQLTRAGR